MRAKFRGKCIVCGRTVLPGDQCFWGKGKGVAHHDCWQSQLVEPIRNTPPTITEVFPEVEYELADQGQVCEHCGEGLQDDATPNTYGRMSCSAECSAFMEREDRVKRLMKHLRELEQLENGR